MMKVWLAAMALGMIGCPAKQGPGPTSGSQGSGAGGATPSVVTVKDAKTCDDVKPRVEQLYRAEATQKEPKRVEDATADNTSMVMRDCAKDPAKSVPCLASVPTVAELEKTCLVPLDDEGTDGEAMRK